MIVAIVGLFDSEFTKEIYRWQKAMVDAGVSDHTLQSRIGPHLTFVGFETENEALVSDFLEGEFQTWNDGSISLKISSLGVFPYKKKVVFAQPVPSQLWMEVHKRILQVCLKAGQVIEQYHLSGNWVPHISLAS